MRVQLKKEESKEQQQINRRKLRSIKAKNRYAE